MIKNYKLKLFLLGISTFLSAHSDCIHYDLRENERSINDILELYRGLKIDAHGVYQISLNAFNKMPQTAAFVKDLKEKYKLEAALETGTWSGNTTKFLSCIFGEVYSIEIDKNYYNLSKQNLRLFKNARVYFGNSATALLPLLNSKMLGKRLFCYLDAHWYEHWPLADELSSINKGIVCIGDFDIQEPGYGFDSYKNQDCNQDIVFASCKPSTSLYINDVRAYHAWPNLAMERRAGRCYFGINTADQFKNISYIKQLRGSSVEERRAHNPEVEGATPSSATTN